MSYRGTRTKWRRDLLNRASSLTYNIETGGLDVVEREPSYRDGVLSSDLRSKPKQDRYMVYLEIMKDADKGMSNKTKRKLRKALNLDGLEGV